MRCRVYSVLETPSGQFFWYRDDRVEPPLVLISPLSLLTVTQHPQPANTTTMTQSHSESSNWIKQIMIMTLSVKTLSQNHSITLENIDSLVNTHLIIRPAPTRYTPQISRPNLIPIPHHKQRWSDMRSGINLEQISLRCITNQIEISFMWMPNLTSTRTGFHMKEYNINQYQSQLRHHIINCSISHRMETQGTIKGS